MEKNATIIGVCAAIGTNGEGIVRSEDMTIFVPFLLLGEKAEIRILKTKGNIAYGKISELLTPAEERVRPVCPVFTKCGGCQLQHENYRAQLKFKTELVKNSLEKIGGVKVSVLPCIPSDKSYAYRNKLQMPIGKVGGENAVGFYAERSHRIVKTDVCPIHPQWAEDVIRETYRFMQTCGLDGFDEQTGEGQLRHIVVRELKGKFIVTLVSTVREIKGIDYFVHLLGNIFAKFSLYLNINADQTNVIFGKEFILVAGSGFYECEEAGIIFEAGAQTFVQVNEGIRGKLYAQAVEKAEFGETVIDCYAGGGLLTAMFAKKCGRAYGIEIVPEASRCADKIKERNGLHEQMTNICGDVAQELTKVLKQERGATIVLDPPRGGVERGVLQLLAKSDVKKIIMISCNPATLARDLGILTGMLKEENGELKKSDGAEGKFEVVSVQPFDMFPQTKHVETLICLKRKQPQ